MKKFLICPHIDYIAHALIIYLMKPLIPDIP